MTFLPLSLGFLARRQGFLKEERGKFLFLIGMIFFESPIVVLILWKLTLNRDYLYLPLLGFSLVLFAGLTGFGFAKKLFREKKEQGAMVLASALSNQGFLLGGFICFLFFGQEGYALSVVYILYFHFTIFFICFPVARYFSSSETISLLKMIRNTLFDIRSLPMLALIFGVLLNLLNVPFSEQLTGILDFVIPFTTFYFMFSIGLQLRLEFSYFFRREAYIIWLIKFILTPLLAYLIILYTGMKGLVAKIIFIESFTPAAAYSIMISTLFDLDKALASRLFVTSTLFFLFIIFPIVVFLLNVLTF